VRSNGVEGGFAQTTSVFALTRVTKLPLRGAGGKPVDFARTIVSHGVAELPPNRVDLAAGTLETTLPAPRIARTVRITARGRKLRIETLAGSVVPQLKDTVAHMFRLDDDLSGFYELVRDDERRYEPELGSVFLPLRPSCRDLVAVARVAEPPQCEDAETPARSQTA
jgi:hypothetical protein